MKPNSDQPQHPTCTGAPHKRKMSYLFAAIAAATSLGAWLAPDNYFKEAMDNGLTRSIRQKLEAYNSHLPEDRLYLHLDKPLYEPGDDVWFSGYIREADKRLGEFDKYSCKFL